MNRRFKGGLGIDKKKKKPKTVSIKNQIRSTERMLRKVFRNHSWNRSDEIFSFASLEFHFSAVIITWNGLITKCFDSSFDLIRAGSNLSCGDSGSVLEVVVDLLLSYWVFFCSFDLD